MRSIFLVLATGMAVALLIGLWVYYQYSYDKFLPDYKQVYQVRRNFYGNGDTITYGGTSLKIGKCLAKPGLKYNMLLETDGLGMLAKLAGDKEFLY